MEKEKRKKYLNEAEKRGYKFTSETIKILDESHPIQSSIGANVEINLRYKFLGLSFIKSKYMGFKESFENQANEIFEDVAFNLSPKDFFLLFLLNDFCEVGSPRGSEVIRFNNFIPQS